MSEEEKKAIENLDKRLTIEKHTKNIGTPVYIADLKIVLNLIQKQQEEIEKKDKIIDELAARVYLTKEEREELAKDVWCNPKHKGFADFVKRYFEKKVEDKQC